MNDVENAVEDVVGDTVDGCDIPSPAFFVMVSDVENAVEDTVDGCDIPSPDFFVTMK